MKRYRAMRANEKKEQEGKGSQMNNEDRRQKKRKLKMKGMQDKKGKLKELEERE